MIAINKQLRRYFVLVTIISVLLIFILSNLGMTIFFNNYVYQSDLKSDQKVVQYIEDIFSSNNRITMGSYPGLMQFIRGEEVEVILYDLSGTTVLDTRTMGNMGRGMGHGWGMANSSSNNLNSELTYREYPLNVNGNVIGKVEIGRVKSILASAEDRAFFLTMNLVYVIALILSIVLVFVISKSVTGKFLKPLLTVKKNIQSISGNGQDNLLPIASDTTEIQELAVATEELSKKIQDQEKLRKRLTSDVAHELRTPLATLQSHLEAMIDGIWEPTPQRLSFCYDELIRLTRLINDLNELSIIESDKIQLKISQVDLSQLLNDMLENLKPLFLEKNIILHRQVDKEIRFKGDNDRLKQIFVNILSNAYKYTPENGKVTVRLSMLSEKVMIEVEDTGIGISAEDLPYIFERFYRGDRSRNRESGGAGIGLTITKSLVEAHGGALLVESVWGSGTTVRIILPKN